MGLITLPRNLMGGDNPVNEMVVNVRSPVRSRISISTKNDNNREQARACNNMKYLHEFCSPGYASVENLRVLIQAALGCTTTLFPVGLRWV